MFCLFCSVFWFWGFFIIIIFFWYCICAQKIWWTNELMNKCYALFLAPCSPIPCMVDSFCVTFNFTGIFLTLEYDPGHHLLSPLLHTPSPSGGALWPFTNGAVILSRLIFHVSPTFHPGLQALSSNWIQFFPAWVVSSVWKAMSPSLPGKPPSKSFKMQFNHDLICPGFPGPQVGLGGPSTLASILAFPPLWHTSSRIETVGTVY